MARAVTRRAWVESSPPETPITTRSSPANCNRFGQSLGLDLVDLGAARVAPLRARGHVREALVAALGEQPPVLREREADRNPPKPPEPVPVPFRGLREAGLAHPLLRQSLEVDLAADDLGLVAESAGLGQEISVLVDDRVAVPRQVGRGFPVARARIQVGGETPAGLAPHEQVPIVRLGHRDVGGREIQQHGGACQRGVGRWRHRHPEILADLHVEGRQRLLLAPGSSPRSDPPHAARPLTSARNSRSASVGTPRRVAASASLPAVRRPPRSPSSVTRTR